MNRSVNFKPASHSDWNAVEALLLAAKLPPLALHASREFQGACPASATLMACSL
jgi:hypothetical protein